MDLLRNYYFEKLFMLRNIVDYLYDKFPFFFLNFYQTNFELKWFKWVVFLKRGKDENKQSFNRDLACRPLLQSHFWIFTPHLYSFSQLDSRLGWPNKRVKTPVVLLHRYRNRRRSERFRNRSRYMLDQLLFPDHLAIRENISFS